MKSVSAVVIAALVSLTASTARAVLTTDQAELRQVAREIGLVPENIAAAGFSETDVDLLVARMQAADDERVALGAAHAQYESAMSSFAARLADWRSNPDEAGAGLDALRQQIRAAQAAIEQRRAELRQHLVRELPQTPSARFQAACSPRNAKLPPEYRVVVWSEDQIASLTNALSGRTRAESRGRPVPADIQQQIADARGRPEIAEAEAFLEGRLQEIRSRFEAAFASP